MPRVLSRKPRSTRLPRETSSASPTITITTDIDVTISDFDLGDEEIAGPRESSKHATLASVKSIAEMGFDRMDILVALFAAKRNEDLAVESIL
jgi:hypothetical protein